MWFKYSSSHLPLDDTGYCPFSAFTGLENVHILPAADTYVQVAFILFDNILEHAILSSYYSYVMWFFKIVGFV